MSNSCQTIKIIVKFARAACDMAFRTVISSKLPMVIILGATGTGKTKLGVELAQKFATEIISADSMQIYKGLDVVTAKATREERELVPHHLLDILEPHQMFTVVDFRDRALKIIDNLLSQDKIPIIVGGTNYYIESIVYNILVEKGDDSTVQLLWDKSRRKRDISEENTPKENSKEKVAKVSDAGTSNPAININPGKTTANDRENNLNIGDEKDLGTSKAELTKQIQEYIDNDHTYTNEQIHDKLAAIDPEMAQRLHPNNRRKVLRSMEVWVKTGRLHSEILAEQKLSEGQLRMPSSTIMLWLKCEQQVHDKRLDARVDDMLEAGLIQELLDFHDRHNRQRIQDGKPPDYTKGIFQTLGFKEFHEFLMLNEEQRKSEEGQNLLKLSIENMKMGTRRYARRQNKMVRGRFLEHPRREVPPIYELDTTNIEEWDENVKNKAIKIIENFINKSPCEYQPLKSEINEQKKNLQVNSNNYCEVCKRLILGDKEYAIHLKSNKHMKVVKLRKREEEQKNLKTHTQE